MGIVGVALSAEVNPRVAAVVGRRARFWVLALEARCLDLSQRTVHLQVFVREQRRTADHAGEKRARRVVLQQSRLVARGGRVVEVRLGYIQIEEPAEQQVVVELFAEYQVAVHSTERHQQLRGLQQPLVWSRRSPERARHLIKRRRKLGQRTADQFFDLPPRMHFRHPISGLQNHQHRPLPPLVVRHPLPPSTDRTAHPDALEFRCFSTLC